MKVIIQRRGLFWRLTWGLALVGLLSVTTPLYAGDIEVDSADPPEAEQATYDLEVTVTGDGFGADSEVDFFVTGTENPGGIKVKQVKRKNPKTLKVTIDVDPDAQTENKFDIQVRSRGRTGKGTELFRVMEKPKPQEEVWQVELPDEYSAVLADCNLYATPSTFSNSESNEVDVSVNKDPETGQIYTVFTLTVAEPGRIGFRNLGFQGCRRMCAFVEYGNPDCGEDCVCQKLPGSPGKSCSQADCYPTPPCDDPSVSCGADYSVMGDFMQGSLHPTPDYDHFSLRFIVWRDITDPDSYEYNEETETFSFTDDAYLWRLNLWNTDQVMVDFDPDYSYTQDDHNIVCAYWIDLEDVVVEWSGGDEWTVTVDQCGLGESFGGVCPDSDYGQTGRYVVFWETYYQGIWKEKGKSGKFTLDSEYRYALGSGTAFKFITKWKRLSNE